MIKNSVDIITLGCSKNLVDSERLMHIRDFYDSYEDLCKSLDLDQNEVKQKLSMIGYEYDESLNQFK